MLYVLKKAKCMYVSLIEDLDHYNSSFEFEWSLITQGVCTDSRS